MHFLKSKLCVGCLKGFEIVDMETLNSQGLLDPSDEDLAFAMKKEAGVPISIFRVHSSDFLLCYNNFAFYVDNGGRRARKDWIVFWETYPTCFFYSYPYVMAAGGGYIEVRDVETGNLEQILPIPNCRCLNTTNTLGHFRLSSVRHTFANPHTTQSIAQQTVFRVKFLAKTSGQHSSVATDIMS